MLDDFIDTNLETWSLFQCIYEVAICTMTPNNSEFSIMSELDYGKNFNTIFDTAIENATNELHLGYLTLNRNLSPKKMTDSSLYSSRKDSNKDGKFSFLLCLLNFYFKLKSLG